MCLALLFYAGKTRAIYQDFGIPPSNAVVDVRAFNVVDLTSVNGAHQVFRLFYRDDKISLSLSTRS